MVKNVVEVHEWLKPLQGELAWTTPAAVHGFQSPPQADPSMANSFALARTEPTFHGLRSNIPRRAELCDPKVRLTL